MRLDNAQGDVPGAAGDVNESLARARRDSLDHGALPQPVDARTHQVVHQVVARRHRVEHLAHQAGLFRRFDGAEAEMRGLTIVGRLGRGVHGADHSRTRV